MEAKELKLSGRYVRRNGTVTPPLETSQFGHGWLTDSETGADYDPYSDGGTLYNEGYTHELDLVAVYVEHVSEVA